MLKKFSLILASALCLSAIAPSAWGISAKEAYQLGIKTAQIDLQRREAMRQAFYGGGSMITRVSSLTAKDYKKVQKVKGTPYLKKAFDKGYYKTLNGF